MSRKSRGGEDSAFAPFDKRYSKYRPSRASQKAAMGEHTRRTLRCDTCETRFEPGETVWVGQDHTHHCSQCGSWRSFRPVVLHERMFVNRTSRMMSTRFKNL